VAEVEAPSKTPAIDKSGPVRKFSDAAIQAHIDRAMAYIPPESAGSAAVVFDAKAGTGGMGHEVGIAYLGRKRLNDGTLSWEVAGVAQWNEKLDAGVKARVAYVWD
jgi:hypothetical protein